MAADSPDMSEYLGVFLEEAEEQVDTLDDGLLRLEREPDNQGLLQGIFRAAHSLKSSSAAMGFPNMSRLCHASENILDRFRAGETRPNTELIDVLLRAVDALKTMKEAIRAGEGESLDISEVAAALEAAATASGDAALPEDSADQAIPENTLHTDHNRGPGFHQKTDRHSRSGTCRSVASSIFS